MSANLNQVFNAEVLNIGPGVTQRRCGYCGQLGHIQPNCRRARSDGHNLHLRIINGMRFVQQDTDQWLRLTLQNMTVRQLKLLMLSIGIDGPGSTFGRTLENYGIIPRGTMLFRFKNDRITILMWFYLNQVVPRSNTNTPIQEEPRKLDIVAKIIQKNVIDEEEFDCPICLNPNEGKEKMISNCNHTVCKPCLTNYFEHLIANYVEKKPCCSLCRANITSISFANTDYLTEVSNKYFVKIT